MYKSHVVAGRIIEIQNDKILTQQGDVFCTYHSRYYMLPPMETEMDGEREQTDDLLITEREHNTDQMPTNLIKPWFSLQKKSANRI